MIIPVMLLMTASCTHAGFNPFTSTETETVELHLPAVPAFSFSDAEFSGFAVSWTDGDGTVQIRKTAEPDILITLKKNAFTPVLARPVYVCAGTEKTPFYPAGAVYPLHSGTGGVKLLWETGFTADTADKMLREFTRRNGRKAAAAYLSLFNWDRLSQYIRSRTADPWLTDQRKLMTAVSSGTFTARSISAAKTAEYTVELPPHTGKLAYPYAPRPCPETAVTDGQNGVMYASVSLPAGISVLLTDRGILTVSVGKNGVTGAAFTPFAGSTEPRLPESVR